MKENYEKSMIEKAISELNLRKSVSIDILPIYGEKITADGINYFNKITAVTIKSHNTEIATYDFEKKVLYSKRNIRNIVILQDLVRIVNDFVKYEKLRIKDSILIDFENYKNDVDAECNLSDYEIACMYELK